MILTIKEKMYTVFAFIISCLAIFTVNSACIVLLGQPEEPESLKRLKK